MLFLLFRYLNFLFFLTNSLALLNSNKNQRLLVEQYRQKRADASAFSFNDCGKRKQCIPGNCKNANELRSCEYLFSYRYEKNADYVEMELLTKRNSPDVKYIAVGFSDDNKMGDDAVTQCVFPDQGNPEVLMSINTPDKSNQAIGSSSGEQKVELLSASTANEYIYCKFKQFSNTKDNSQSDLKHPNLSKQFHILLARGAISSPSELSPHSTDQGSPDYPFVSNQKVDLLKEVGPGESNGNGASSTLQLIDYHGILMTQAWILLVAVAIYSARYLRSAWPDRKFMGVLMWFHIHRTCNFLAVITVVFSGILAFKHTGYQWKGPWFNKQQSNLSVEIHSLAGLLAIILAVFQPFGALFRCGTEHPKRYIFNWIHRSLGLTAFTLAFVALFIALLKFKKHFAVPSLALWTFIGFLICILALVLMSEILRFTELKQEQTIKDIELKVRDRGSRPTPSDSYYYQTQKHTHNKVMQSAKVIFGFVVGVCIVTAVIITLLILFQ